MNSKVLSLLAGTMIAAVSALAPDSAHAVTVTNTSALGCHYKDQPPTAPIPDLRYQSDGIYNAGGSWVEIICPVSWAPTYGYPGIFQVSGSGAYSWGIVSAYGSDGTFHASAYWDSYDWTIYGYSYYVGWAPLYASNFWDFISADVWMPPGGKLRGIQGQ